MFYLTVVTVGQAIERLRTKKRQEAIAGTSLNASIELISATKLTAMGIEEGEVNTTKTIGQLTDARIHLENKKQDQRDKEKLRKEEQRKNSNGNSRTPQDRAGRGPAGRGRGPGRGRGRHNRNDTPYQPGNHNQNRNDTAPDAEEEFKAFLIWKEQNQQINQQWNQHPSKRGRENDHRRNY